MKKISVPANHSDMCKFADSRDIGYRRISDQIMAYLDDVDSLDASTFSNETRSLPQEYVVVPHDDPSRPSSQSMTVSLDASTSPDRTQSPPQEYVVFHYDVLSCRFSHTITSQHSSQSVDDQHYDYHIRFEIVTDSQDQFRVIDKVLRDPSIDKWTNLSDMNFKLSMTGSGKSGSLLFKNDTVAELFSVTAGIHNYRPWCGIATDLPDEATARGITQSYYGPQARSWDHDKYELTSLKGTFISVDISQSWDGTFITKVTIRKATSVAILDHNRVHNSLDPFSDC